MEFQELFKLLFRKKYYLIIAPVVSAILGFMFRFSSDRLYTSESQVSTGLTLTMDFTGESSKVNPFEMSLSFSNLTENMASKTVTNRLGYKLLFHDLSADRPFRAPDFVNAEVSKPLTDTLNIVLEELKKSISDFSLISKTTEMGRYVYDLLELYEYDEMSLVDGIIIYRVGNTDFINLRYTSEVPQLSSFVVNEWATGFIEYYNYQKTNRLNESLAVLSEILKDKQRLLDERTNKLNQYKSRYVNFSNDNKSNPVGELEGLIRDKNSDIRNLNYRLQNIRSKIAEEDQSSSFSSRKKIITLKNQLDRLSNSLMSDPNNRVLLDSMEFCRKRLETEMYLHTSGSSNKGNLKKLFDEENELELKYKVALEDLNNLKNQYSIEKGTVRNLATTKSGLENLETDVEQARTDYLSAQDKYNQARSRLLVGSSSLKVSYYGDIPEEPESRKTMLFTAVGGVAGFAITLFLIISLELLDSRIKNPLKFKRETDMIPSVTIPYLEGVNIDFYRLLLGELKGVDKQKGGDEYLQSLRKMRFDLQHCNGKVFLFTSLRAGAGKSFLLSSLAYSLSLTKKKVLIIDTNFRNNSLTQSFEKGQKVETSGINIFLSKNEIKKYDVISKEDFINNKIIEATQNPFVYIMKSQSINQSPEEIFSRLDFKKLIDAFKKDFDYIFLEGAALNNYSDTKELSVYSDYMIPIFSVNDPFSAQDRNSLTFIKENKAMSSLRLLNNVNTDDIE